MKTNQYEIKVVKRCPKCDWRIFDKVTPTSGIIELKCPNCRKVVEIDLSYRTPSRRRATYYREPCHTYTYVEDQITKNRIDIVLSHTCPYKYEPRDAFLPIIDQSTVDDSTERWLDGIEEKVDYKAWLCGHWHIEKQIDKLWPHAGRSRGAVLQILCRPKDTGSCD